MKFRDHTYALGSARGEEVETVEMIDRILVVLGEPVLRGRESLSVLELHIRRGEGKLDQSLGDFGNAIRGLVFYLWRIPEWQRLTGFRIHTSILSCALENADHTVFTKNPIKKSQKILIKYGEQVLRQHRRLFGDLSAASDLNKQSCFVSDMWRKYLRFLEESIYSKKRWLQI
jgi:hypothetical protein